MWFSKISAFNVLSVLKAWWCMYSYYRYNMYHASVTLCLDIATSNMRWYCDVPWLMMNPWLGDRGSRLRISVRHCALLSCQNTSLFQNHEWDWENAVSWTICKVTHLVANSITLISSLLYAVHSISNVEGSMTITAEAGRVSLRLLDSLG